MDPALIRFGLGLLVISALTMALQRRAQVRLGWTPLIAIARASAQLAVIAALLHGILSVPWTVVLFLILMASTASWTSMGRLAGLWRGSRAAVLGVVSGGVAAIGAVFALQLLAFDVRSLVAVSGIVIGNCMTAATLAGRNFLRMVRSRRDEVEGWLALGALPAQAHHEIAVDAVRESLIPNLDQTRATGLVTLPGAFVGALMGGASPVAAAQFQLVVLAAIGLAMTTTAMVVTHVVSRSPFLPAVTN